MSKDFLTNLLTMGLGTYGMYQQAKQARRSEDLFRQQMEDANKAGPAPIGPSVAPAEAVERSTIKKRRPKKKLDTAPPGLLSEDKKSPTLLGGGY
tara:strand:+ start:723 stop:1007 length:285 start_codon:yes stop_codon:yes gene_type:complete